MTDKHKMLLLALALAASAAWGQSERRIFSVDTQSQWREWKFPTGILEFNRDGSFSLRQYEDEIDAVADAQQFTHVGAKDAELRGGIWKVGSTAPGTKATNVLRSAGWWKPDPNAPIEDWLIEVNLGRLVAVHTLRLTFPDTVGARPLGDFRIFVSRGMRELTGQNVFAYHVLGGTNDRFNTRRVLEFKLEELRNLTDVVVETGDTAVEVADPEPFQQMQYIRIRADSKNEDAAIQQIEALAFGENVSLGAIERGGNMLELTGRGGDMVDGDINTSWQNVINKEGVRLEWILDLGARFWVRRIYMLGAEHRVNRVGDMQVDHELNISDQTSKVEPKDLDLELLTKLDTTEEPGGQNDLQYFLPTPVAMRYLSARYEGGRNGDMAELVVVPTGHVAGAQLESDFIDLGKIAGDGRVKQITAINWDAVEPEGTQVRVRTRTGFKLTEQVEYYKKDGTLLENKQQYDDTNQFLRGRTDTSLVAGDDWSVWSVDYLESGIFLSPSPRRFLQVQLILDSETPTTAPVINNLQVEYIEALLEGVEGEVGPRVAEPGMPQLFTYRLWGDFGGGGKFDRLLLLLPSKPDPDRISVRKRGEVVEAGIRVSDLGDSLIVDLPTPVESTRDTIEVDMEVQIARNPTIFTAFVGRSTEPDLWQDVVPRALPAGCSKCNQRSTQVFFPAVPKPDDLVRNLTISPRIGTPNGDGVGEQVEFRFLVLNVNVEPEVRVYSLDGRLVAELEGGAGGKGDHLFTWSGRDMAGNMLPPGIYLSRITLGTQVKDHHISRTVGLAY